MTFADIPAGVSVFIDANSFVYHFVTDPVWGPACTGMLERVARQEIGGFSSTHVLADVAHRVMTTEAIAALGLSASGIARRMRKHPGEIRKLTLFRHTIDDVPKFGVHVLPISLSLLAAATALSQQQLGLLTGDALIVALMQQEGISHLASNDADFDRVPGITRYAPA